MTLRSRAQALAMDIRILAILLNLALFAAASPVPASAQPAVPPRCDWSGQTYSDFYAPPDLGVLTPDRLGELLRVEHIRSYTPEMVAAAANLATSPYGAEAYRVLYLSQAPAGTPQAVSGLMLVPTGSPPAGGFPVLVHGHGTVGVADKCAPSKSVLDVSTLLSWIARGLIVSATDDVGLGTPGLHPYGVGDVGGFGMLDSARAARRFCDDAHNVPLSAANRIILEGYSQGGHSALFAHQLWSSYAPELNVLGNVVFAPGAEPRYLAQHMAGQFWSPLVSPFAMAMYAQREYYGAPLSLQPWVREPYATELPEQAESRCLIGLAVWLGARPDKVFQPDMLSDLRRGRFQDLQPWTTYIEDNTPGNFSSDVPVLVLQGEHDAIIPAETSDKLVKRLCDHGVPAKLNRYADAGHGNIVRVGQPDALEWISDRLAGKPVSDYCTGDNQPLIGRDIEPVVVNGPALTELHGTPVSRLFVYAYDGIAWRQIPAQVDEVTATGAYTTIEDGFLDSNDEIVFMAKDLGTQAPASPAIDAVLPVSTTWYAIEVTDPISPTKHGWAYLIRSNTLTPTLTADYVRFDARTGRIQGENYNLGFPARDSWLDYLALGNGPDILDRTKVYLDCWLPLVCPVTETKTSPFANNLIKDGPVRVIVREGTLLAYGSQISWAKPYKIPPPLTGNLRVSTDFNAAVTGATYYNASVPDGVTIDGQPDDVPTHPASSWWQVSTDNGSLIQVTDVAAIGELPSNHYIDDATWDATDTGDRRHYGDTGLNVSGPNLGADYRFNFYLLADKQSNLGSMYAAFFKYPLVVQASLRGTKHHQYLPFVIR